MNVPPSDRTEATPRMAVLDILRGLAILGILFMNVNDMGQSFRASFADVRHLGWSAADRAAWWMRAIVADGTARCLLELLFGAGMVILTDRAARVLDEREVVRAYQARNLVLFGFGLVHVVVLLWPGDILHSYAIAAIVAVWFRRWRPRWLIAVGLCAALPQVGDGVTAYAAVQRQQALVVARDAGRPLSAREQAAVDFPARQARAQRATIAREDAARGGTAWTWAAAAWSYSLGALRDGTEVAIVREALGVMLIGAALFRLGILQGARSTRFYVALAIAGYAVGLPLRAVGAYEVTRFDHAPQTIWATYEIARIATTLGHVALVTLIVATARGARLLRPFAAAGRVALTIYVLQTIVGLWILFPPFGFALYGRFGWAALMAIALAIDAVLLAAALLYLRRYAIGPVEWAWRSLVETHPLPWRAPRADASAPVL